MNKNKKIIIIIIKKKKKKKLVMNENHEGIIVQNQPKQLQSIKLVVLFSFCSSSLSLSLWSCPTLMAWVNLYCQCHPSHPSPSIEPITPLQTAPHSLNPQLISSPTYSTTVKLPTPPPLSLSSPPTSPSPLSLLSLQSFYFSYYLFILKTISQ